MADGLGEHDAPAAWAEFVRNPGPVVVGDSKGILESSFRGKHIKWICNAKVTKVEAGKMYVTEHDEDGRPKRDHVLPFKYSMMLSAFKGVDAVFGIDGPTNRRGFITIDEYQRNARYRNIFAVGVCVAIPPVEPTPIPTGTPKTGYMIESMVTATAHNIRELLDGARPTTLPGMRSAWRTSGPAGWCSSPCRRFRRAMSN